MVNRPKFYTYRVNSQILVTHVEFRRMEPFTSCVTEENAVNYRKVAYSLGEKCQEWNLELLFHEGIIIIG